ncbi:alpha-ketoacid dehydrogenase subunit beta [Pseudosulfitobacter sp. DSM 107133]|uniref:alpha-ketoacid dehydrogenase subunit beta n=1 Tax=Pseudosulfitobacter sp. DSM 107133 TaxID=2883100 RepID=UPI000DF329F8|nr:alpha-ketoacid dehydrogenase subunit beta [Pseudosulfitobacter sp. DSM 107133]UOA29218.1 2-oxoisovalerate dehydrogenase subunit beta [Pseudosulfitobacter sp. DSM 107133]
MARMTMIEALRSAMDVSLERDPSVIVFGEDVGYFGGVFRCTAGLQKKYGEERVFDTPINESAIVGLAVGMAAQGMKPCVEIQFADYMFPAYDQITQEAARLRHRSNEQFTCPMVVRMPTGGGIFGGQTHSQSPEALFTHVAGLKVVIPATPYDAKGLLIAAIEDPDPVIFLEPKRLYNGPFYGDHSGKSVPWSAHPAGEVPEGHYTVPLGKAAVVRAGSDVTVLTYGTMVYVTEAAVKETGRCVVVHEATRTSGFGAELIAEVQEACFWHLRAPIQRITGWDAPYPHAQEWDYFPSTARISRALNTVMED